jgi:hypothetical protein
LSARAILAGIRASAALLAACACAFAARAQSPTKIDPPAYRQPMKLRGQRALIDFKFDAAGNRLTLLGGTDTELKLPAIVQSAALELLGVCICGKDLIAVFDTPEQRADAPGGFAHLIQVWRGPEKSAAMLIQEATITGGPGANVKFPADLFESPSPNRAPIENNRIFVSVSATTNYSDVWVLDTAAQTASKLFTAWRFDVADLANDGRVELVAWQRLTYDLRCNFMVASDNSYPEVYADSGRGFAKVWPPANWKNPDPRNWHAARGKLDGVEYMVQGTFADLRHEEKYELVAIVSRANPEHTQRLAAYEWKGGAFVELASTPLQVHYPAFMINAVTTFNPQPHVVIRAATLETCEAGGALDGQGTVKFEYSYANAKFAPFYRNVGLR